MGSGGICVYSAGKFPEGMRSVQGASFVSVFDLPNDGISHFSKIRQEKIFKILPWKFLPDGFDFAIWVDNPDLILETEIDEIAKSLDGLGDYFVFSEGAGKDYCGNLNALSQIEDYEKSGFSLAGGLLDTSVVGVNLKSDSAKKFSLRWIGEVLRESLADEISFSWLAERFPGISIRRIERRPTETGPKTDCFFKIVVPNYNNGDALQKCLDSILCQTFDDFKIVVVDDCSTDSSIDVARQYAEDFPDKVHVVELEKNMFSGYARNVGASFGKFSSKYTWFVDGDDRLYSDGVLKALYEKAMVSGADMVTFDCIYANGSGGDVKKFSVPDFSKPEDAIGQFGIAPWHRIVRSSMVVPFFEKCIRRQDLATVFRQYSKCSTFAHLEQICYVYNSRDYSSLYEPAWNLQRIYLEMKRQVSDESIRKDIRNAILAYLKKYPKVFSKFDGVDLNRQIVVGMASYPLRREGMMKVVRQILSQCDYLCIYLNEYESIPDELLSLSEEERLKILTKTGGVNLKDYGKFFWFGRFPGYYLTVDDDLSYPEDYCRNLVAALESKGASAVVGMHGNDFTVVEGSFVAGKTCHPFCGEESVDVPVDCLGTGAAAFYPDGMDDGFRDKVMDNYLAGNDLDMSVSILAKAEGRMLYRVASRKDFVVGNGSNLVNPLANIHFAWERRYVQYDFWLNEKSERDGCVFCCVPSAKIDMAVLDEFKRLWRRFNEDGLDFFAIPIEERALQSTSAASYFSKFEFVEDFLKKYKSVSVMSLDGSGATFDFDRSNAKDELRKIFKIREKNLRRMSDKILLANLKKKCK